MRWELRLLAELIREASLRVGAEARLSFDGDVAIICGRGAEKVRRYVDSAASRFSYVARLLAAAELLSVSSRCVDDGGYVASDEGRVTVVAATKRLAESMRPASMRISVGGGRPGIVPLYISASGVPLSYASLVVRDLIFSFPDDVGGVIPVEPGSCAEGEPIIVDGTLALCTGDGVARVLLRADFSGAEIELGDGWERYHVAGLTFRREGGSLIIEAEGAEVAADAARLVDGLPLFDVAFFIAGDAVGLVAVERRG